MAEPPLDTVLAQGIGGTLPEISREEILRQIFGDVGELIDEKKDYVFRSFWDRDDCHRMLSLFLMKYNANDLSRSSIISMTLNSKKQELSETTESIPEPVVRDNRKTSVPRTSARITNPIAADAPAAASNNTTQPQPTADDAIFDCESGSVPSTLEGEGLDNASFFDLEVSKSRLKLPVISNATLDISLDEFLRLFVLENARFSYTKYHEMVKDTNLVASLWEEQGLSKENNPSTPSTKFTNKNREIKFFKPVNLPGLASTRGVKVQRYLRFGDYGAIVVSSTRLEDVPAADTFSVDDMLAVHVGGDGKLIAEISFQVSFIKSTYMKFIIERSTNAEMSKWLESFFQHLKKVCEDFKNGTVSLAGVPAENNPTLATCTSFSGLGSVGLATPSKVSIPNGAAANDKRESVADNAAEELPSTLFIRPDTPSHNSALQKGLAKDNLLATKNKRSNSLSSLNFRFQTQQSHGFFKRLFIEFIELPISEQLKTLFIFALLVFLVYNYYRWKQMHAKMAGFEAKVAEMEKLLEQFLLKYEQQ